MSSDRNGPDLPDEAALVEVTALLASLPRPTIPGDVAARIDEALARAARPVPRPRRWYFAVAAAAAVIAGSFGWSQLQSTPSTGVASSVSDLTALGALLAPALRAGAAPTQPAPALATLGAAASAGASPGPLSTLAAAPSLSAPFNYSIQSFAGTFAANSVGLTSCLRGIGRSGQVPSLIRSVQLRGADAIALAFENAGGRSADLVVVAPDCSASAPHLLGQTTVVLQ